MTDGMKMFTVAALAAFDEEGRGPKVRPAERIRS